MRFQGFYFCIRQFFFGAILSIFASQSFATPSAQQDTPPESGVGLLVGGIVTTSVLSVAGMLTLINSGYSPKSKQQQVIGWSLLVLGGGVGVPMIVSGGSRIRQARRWRREQKAKQEADGLGSNDTATSEWNLSLGLLEQKPTAYLTYYF